MLLDHNRPWSEYPLVVVDFETTGVDPLECSPVSIAAIRLVNGHEVGAFYSLLRPSCPIPEGATAIHGITDAMCADAPELVDVAGELYKLAVDAVPVGYNGALYDKPILHRFISGTDCPLFEPDQGWIDPLVMIRAIDKYTPGKGRHKLEHACARWGVPFAEGEAHNALADVRGAARLLYRLIELGRLKTGTTLGRLLEYTAAKATEQQREFEAYRARQAARAAQTELPLDETERGEPMHA